MFGIAVLVGIAYGVAKMSGLAAMVTGAELRGIFVGGGVTFLRVELTLLLAGLWTIPAGVAIGLNAKLKIINAAVYWTTIGNQATKAQTGFADWFQDYPHPTDWFGVLLDGTRITQTHNNNYANFNDPDINKQIEQLGTEPTLTTAVNQKWASVDKQVMEQAPWAPFINQQGIDTFNSDVDLSCYVFNVNYQFDFSQICLKK